MIAVPWFKFPWTFATGDAAHALVQRAVDGDTDAKGQIEQIKAQADAGNTLAKEAWRYFSAIIRLVVAGQPPPSVLRQMKRDAAVGGGHGGGGFGYPGGVPWGYGFYEPFFMDEMIQSVAERAAEDAAAEVEERKGGVK
jgi:hypothetical protein